MKTLSSRERLLETTHILQRYTDEQHPLSIHAIHSHFPEGTKVGIGAVRDDLATLEASTHVPVKAIQKKKGMPKKYYFAKRPFEIHELRLLMDAISAAKFIPQHESTELMQKIRKLTSVQLASQLTNELLVAGPVVAANTKSIKVVQVLHEAIFEQRVVAFKYGRYSEGLIFQLSNNGEEYIVHPLGLVWNNDRYYLVAYFVEQKEIRQYRVDRMRNIVKQQESFVVEEHFNLQEYTSKMFHMFGGEMISLEIEFTEKLLNAVIDRFGLQANIQYKDRGVYTLKARASMSEGLLRWVLRWGSEMRVLHPQSLIRSVKEEITTTYKQYKS